MANPEALSSVTNEINALYDDIIGDTGRDIFSSRILPLAQEQLGADPNAYSSILKQLLDVAGSCKAGELIDLWSNGVTAETFSFHREFDRLLQADNSRTSNFVFHINERRLFDSLNGGTLIPKYILDRRPFDPKEASWETGIESDYYRVCFADGTVDELAGFLAGHALLNLNITHEGREKEENSPIFSRTHAIGAADYDKTRNSAANLAGGNKHEVLTPCGVRRDLFIDVRDSTKPVPVVAVIPIPFTLLLPTQLEDLKAQGRHLFETGLVNDDFDYFVTTPDAGAAAYQATIHQTLATKFALQQFLQANG